MKKIAIILLMVLTVLPSSAQQAQELVQKVIDARLLPDYGDHDFFTCARYEKTTIALNDINPLNPNSKFVKKHPWLQKTIVKNNLSGKFVLPIMTNQNVTEFLWRRNPEKKIYNVLAINREGLNEILDLDYIIDKLIGKDFQDYSIYDDTLTIDEKDVISPVGKDGMQYYDYELITATDTTASIMFGPKPTTPLGVVGQMKIMKDSVWRVKYVTFSLSEKSRHRYIDNMFIAQEYMMTKDGLWVISRNELTIEMRKKFMSGKVCYAKSEQYSHFSCDSIPDKRLRHKSTLRYDGMADYRDPQFWAEYDNDLAVKLQNYREQDSLHCSVTINNGNEVVRHRQSEAQRRINDILTRPGQNNWVRCVTVPLRALINNYIELGDPPIFNIEPVTSLISYNSVDKWRFRFGGTTTANLHKRIFLSGYAAYGTSSKNVYYQAKGSYSFRDKKYEASEFPRRNINIESRYDLCYFGEINTHPDHDNLFKSYNWDNNPYMMYYRMHKIEFERDEWNGIGYRFSVQKEKDWAVSLPLNPINTTELRWEVLYSPRNSRFASRKLRVPINSECPSIGLAHTIGVKMLGGEFSFNSTELKVTKEWYLGTLGIGRSMLKAGAVWNSVPYVLLLAPPANISYISDEGSFNLIKPFAFANDRYAQLILSLETNGNVIGLIPAIKRLRWKEYIAVKMLWGYLTEKNNPLLYEGEDADLYHTLPRGVAIMDSKIPYIEGAIGIHNIFHILNVEYIHRFTYRDLEDAKLGGVRFSLHFDF